MMKKRNLIGLFVILVVVLGVYFYPFGTDPSPPTLNCGTQGESIDFTDTSTPNECCFGLRNVNNQDSFSIADECYWAGTVTGKPILACSACGNGICENVESVCGCPQDCTGKGESIYGTVPDFCEEGYEKYCGFSSEGAELELCKLCDSLNSPL